MNAIVTRGLAAALAAGLIAGFGACKNKVDTAERRGDSASIVTGTPPSPGDSAPVIPPAPVADTHPKMSDANIFAAMGLTDSGEVVESQLAMRRSRDREVRGFAKMMIDDHSKMIRNGKALAAKLSIVPEVASTDNTRAGIASMMEELSSASGTEFDTKFLSHAVEDHQKVLVKLNQMKPANDSLKQMITKVIPIVQMHLDHAQELQNKLQNKGQSKTGKKKKGK